MFKKIALVLALASLSVRFVSNANSETIAQDFSGNPLTNGWSVFGDPGLFAWDSTNQSLRVTWDSTRTNSYFYQPLGTTVTRHDDFQIEFDLRLEDCISGSEPGKTGPLQIGIGLINLAGAASGGFGRGIFGSAPNIAEFNYFPYGYYEFGGDIFPSDSTTVFDFVSSSGFAYSPTSFDPYYEFELPTNRVVHVELKYTAWNQTLAMNLKTNAVVCYHPLDAVLGGSVSGFGSADDFAVDTFSISSYSSFGDAYNSVLGHGAVDNIYVNIPVVPGFTGTFSNRVWLAQFRSRTNWVYTLERTVDFSNWTNVSEPMPGNAASLSLPDPDPPAGSAFYRVRAQLP